MRSFVFKIVHKCANCTKNYKLADYRKGTKILKNCITCRKYNREYLHKNKCIHDKIKYRCKDCNGKGFCIHDKPKYTCKDCNGKGICGHNRQKYDCKICGDSLEITIRNMLHSSKQKDKKYNRLDELNFINYDYVKNLILESNNKCCYCRCNIQYIKFEHNLATIERLDNNIGHIIGNCTIACKMCNLTKFGNYYHLFNFLF